MEEKKIPGFEGISTKEEFLKDTEYLDDNRAISSDFFNGESVSDDMSFIKKKKPSDEIF
jgi:hypothetical protein